MVSFALILTLAFGLLVYIYKYYTKREIKKLAERKMQRDNLSLEYLEKKWRNKKNGLNQELIISP